MKLIMAIISSDERATCSTAWHGVAFRPTDYQHHWRLLSASAIPPFFAV